MATDETVLRTTFTAIVAAAAPARACTVVEPGATAVTNPDSSTLAIDREADDQLTVASRSGSPFPVRAVTAIVLPPPTGSVSASGEMVRRAAACGLTVTTA